MRSFYHRHFKYAVDVLKDAGVDMTTPSRSIGQVGFADLVIRLKTVKRKEMKWRAFGDCE